MSKVAKVALGLMIVTMLAKILGFGRELVLASSYGASMYSDAYLTAMNIPLVLFDVIGSTLGTVLIPMYYQVHETNGEEKALKFINNVFNIVIILCVILAILGFVFTKDLVKIFAIGFEGEVLKVAINFTRVLILAIIFTGLSYIMTSYLQIKGNFTIPGLISVPKNIIIITSIILSVKLNNPYIMIWGTFIGISSDFLFQLPFAIKRGYKYMPYINIKDEYIKKCALLIGPVFIGIAVSQVNAMIDRTLASTLAEGSISALNYANKLNNFVNVLFVMSVASVIYPMLSKLSMDNNKDEFTNSIVKSVNSIVLLVMPISVGAIVLANPIVKILFERGAFDSRATSMTAIALIMYSLGMVAYGLRCILDKVFYSLQDTKTPMINSIISICMNILLNLILIKYFKIAGLALATSISSITCVVLLFRSIKKNVDYFKLDKIIVTLVKSLISAVVMGVLTYFTYNFTINMLGNDSIVQLIALFVSVVIGAITYGVLTIILKVEEIEIIKSMVLKKLKRKNNL